MTPYTIVNYTSHNITVKRVLDKGQGENSSSSSNSSLVPKQYEIFPGEQVDYEVDYEEEARQLMKISRDELLRKQDFVNVFFGNGQGKGNRIESKITSLYFIL